MCGRYLVALFAVGIVARAEFTVTVRELYVDEKGEWRVGIDHTIALGDSRYVEHVIAYGPVQGKILDNSRFGIDGEKRFTISDLRKEKSVWKDPSYRSALSAYGRELSCREKFDRADAVSEEVISGVRVFKVVSDTGVDIVTEWRSPQLGCSIIQETVFNRVASREIFRKKLVSYSFKLDPKLFSMPASYKSVKRSTCCRAWPRNLGARVSKLQRSLKY